VKIAGGCHFQVEEAVAREAIEHVVEKGDAGINFAAA